MQPVVEAVLSRGAHARRHVEVMGLPELFEEGAVLGHHGLVAVIIACRFSGSLLDLVVRKFRHFVGQPISDEVIGSPPNRTRTEVRNGGGRTEARAVHSASATGISRIRRTGGGPGR